MNRRRVLVFSAALTAGGTTLHARRGRPHGVGLVMSDKSDDAGNFCMEGGVLAYSVDFRELGVRGAAFVDRILRGAKAGELPIEEPTRFELVVNQKCAKGISALTR